LVVETKITGEYATRGTAKFGVEVTEEGGAAIIINLPMLEIFNQLAQAANVETGDMLIHCLGGLLFESDEFKKSVHHEH
jgi:hypothetical protein